MPSAIALATISASAGESWSRGFHERAIWRARKVSLQNRKRFERHFANLHNRNADESTSLAPCSAMRFDRRIRDFALRKRMVTTLPLEWA
jgi:hypothetical protein